LDTQIHNGVLNIGIVGAGGRGIGAFGAMLAVRDDARVAALADVNTVRLEAAARGLPQPVACYADAAQMAASERLDVVIVTSPDYCHAGHVISVLHAGVRHVLVDKPLATTVQDCQRIADAAREAGGHVAIGFNMRHLPVIRKIKEVIDDGLLGELMLIENQEFYDGGRTYMARWNRRREWSGGLWIHKGSHDFDIFNWWNAGGNPIRVAAFGGNNALRSDKLPFALRPDTPIGPHCRSCAYQNVCPDFAAPDRAEDLFSLEAAQEDGYWKDLCIFLSDKDTHDNGIALVEYDNNVRASHSECFVCNFTDRRYTITGDRGTLLASLANPTQMEFRPRWGPDQIIPVSDALDGGHGGADPLLLENFLNSVRGIAPAASGLRDGLRAVAIGQAAELAWREHRLVAIKELVDLA
jgi:predicted dehydrogenase